MARYAAALIVLAACGFEHGRLPGATPGDGGDNADDAPMIDTPSTPGAIGVGSVISGTVNYTTGGQVAYTVPAGTSLLVVCLSTSYGGTTATSVRFNGATLAQHGFINAVVLDGRVEIWSLIDPPAGAGAVQLTLSDNDSAIVVGIASFTNTHLTAPLGMFHSAYAINGDPSISVPSAADHIVLAAVLWNGNYATLTAGSGQTNTWSNVTSGITGAGSTKAGSATTTLRWDVANDYDDYWALGAVAVLPR